MGISRRVKSEVLDVLGRMIAALPPFLMTLHYFPIWVEESPGATLSGVVILSFLVCMIPMWRKLGELKKMIFSASTPVLWIVLFGIFYFLESIAASIKMIALAGLVGSLVSLPIVLWRNKYRVPDGEKEDKA